MGSTGMHVEPGTKVIDVMRGEFRETEILDYATVNGTFYAAMRGKDSDVVFGAVVLVSRYRNSYENFVYKAMSEDMGPNETHCPKRILDLLSDTDSGYAQEWRAKCRSNIAARSEAGKVKPGTTVEFAHPIPFTDGISRSVFTFEGRTTFMSADGLRVRISRWKDRKFVIRMGQVAA